MDEMNLGPEAQELHDSIVAEIQSGVLKLKDGLPFGTGDETEMQYDVTLRELTAGDLIDAQAAAEKLVMSKEGPILVSSPSRMGLEMLRRQIASVGCIKGPLSMALIRKLSADDFQRLSLATEMYDMAVAASLTQERGEWLRCRNDIEKAATAIGVILKSGPEWALSLPLSRFFRHCQQAKTLSQYHR